MLKELRVLVIWSSSQQVKLNLPAYFRKRFQNTNLIINSTEFRIQVF